MYLWSEYLYQYIHLAFFGDFKDFRVSGTDQYPTMAQNYGSDRRRVTHEDTFSAGSKRASLDGVSLEASFKLIIPK